MLEFNVNHQIVKRTDTISPVINSQNYLQLKFNFTDDWDNTTKYAYFENTNVSEPVKVQIVDNVVIVPTELLTIKSFKFWLVGYNETDHIVITTNISRVELMNGGKADAYYEGTDIEPYDEDLVGESKSLKLAFNVSNQILTRTDKNPIVANSQNYLYTKFTFTDDWDNVSKYVYFKIINGDTYKLILNEDNETFIPYLVCKSKCFAMWVIGVNAESEKIITTSILKLEFIKGGKIEEGEEDKPYVIETDFVNKIKSDTLNTSKDKSVYTINIDSSVWATTEYVDKYGGKIDKISVNGIEQTITNKSVNINVPTKLSELSNDNYTVIDDAYVHTDNNYTDIEKAKLASLENYDDTAIKNRILVIEDDYLKSADKTELKNLINDETLRAEKAENNLSESLNQETTDRTLADTTLSNKVQAIEDDYLKSDDKTELSNKINDVEKSLNDEISARKTNDDNEAEARSNADTSLSNRIKTIEDDYLKTSDKNELDGKISTEKTRAEGIESGISSRVTIIENKIPSAASSTNQLADKAWVNSSIATNTATFQGTFNSVDDLPTTGVDINDYAFVKIIDSITSQVKQYDRYKYTTKWEFEYTLNNSSFTQDQWNAINSGATSALITSYSNHIANTDIHVTTTNKAAWNAKYDKPSTGIPKSDLEESVKTSLGKADSAVQDDTYVHTDNNYTTAEKTKLNGIAEGAEVNVNADWNATSGDAQILNKPTTMKNPNFLTFGAKTYDGSEAKEITKSDLGLGNVENTALSTWAGSSNLTTAKVGTLGSAAIHGVDTSISASTTSTNLPTSAAVESRINAHKGIDKVGTVTGIKMNSASKTVGSDGVVDLGTIITDVSGKENTSNKVTSISSSSTDTQYPSAKAIYDMLPVVIR